MLLQQVATFVRCGYPTAQEVRNGLRMPASRQCKCLQEKTVFTLTSNKYLYFYIPITRMTPL